MDTQEQSASKQCVRKERDVLLEEIANIGDIHIKEMGVEGLRQVEGVALDMYEEYAGLQEKFDLDGYSKDLYRKVVELEGRLKELGHKYVDVKSADPSKGPDDPNINFLSMINNKMTGLSGKLQIAKIKAERATA